MIEGDGSERCFNNKTRQELMTFALLAGADLGIRGELGGRGQTGEPDIGAASMAFHTLFAADRSANAGQVWQSACVSLLPSDCLEELVNTEPSGVARRT